MFGIRTRASTSHLAALRGIPMFSGLSDAVLARVDGQMVEMAVAPGAFLTTEHERGREAFIVADGIAEVRVDGVAISSVGVGDLVGEMSLLDGGPRTATVIALTPMRVYVLDPRQFAELFADPQSAQWIAAHLSTRLREMHLSTRSLAIAG
jgi:CRP/FNR family cyclic AMP-dependent transcriptional regulator